MIQPEPISMLHKRARRNSNLLLLFVLLSWQIHAVQSRGLRATQELLDEQNEEGEVIDVNDEIDHNNGDEEGVFIEGDILASWDAISQLYSPEYALELGLHPPSEEKENLMSSSIQDVFESKEAMVQSLDASNFTQPVEKQEITAKMTPPPPSSNGQEAPLNPPDGDPVGYPVPLIPLPPPDSPDEEEEEKDVNFYWPDSFNENMDMYKFHVHVSKKEYTAVQFRKIKKALRQLSRLTGVMHIQFYRTRQPPSNVDYIRVFKGDGCWSALGQTSRSRGQDLSLDSSCLVTGTIQHEFMHALGFYHTHMRPDRDDYVTVNEENIKEGGHVNFKKVENSDTLGTQYDFSSILHYGAYQYSKNNQPTIDANGNAIGQRKKVSSGDRLMIRLHYQCSDGPRTLQEYQTETCNDSNCKCGFKMKGCGGDSSKCKGIQAVQSRLRGTQELLDEQNEEDEVIDVNDEIDLTGQHHYDGDEEGVFIDGDILVDWNAASQLYSPEIALELGLHPPSEESENTNAMDLFKSKEAMAQSLDASNFTQPDYL